MSSSPPRIISLLPSATEIVCELGLLDQLVGVSHECDYPEEVRGLPKITRSLIPSDATSGEIDRMVRDQLRTKQALYTLDYKALESLRPDLLITQSLCNVCAVAESEVSDAVCRLPNHPKVLSLEPTSLGDVFESLMQVGEAAGIQERANEVVLSLKERVATVEERMLHVTYRPRVVLLEWIDPPFSSGHWSPELVRIAGGLEVVGLENQPSRTVSWQDIVSADPDVMVIACCGFGIERTLQDVPTLKSYPGFDQLSCVRTGRVFVVDGNAYFSRPGPRLVDSLELLATLFHPDNPSFTDPAAFQAIRIA
jgi:iron complex transport system substrate-binding protein